jgi:hypothetical protein
MLTFLSKTVAQRTPPGVRQSVQQEGARTWASWAPALFYLLCIALEWIIHAYAIENGLCCAVSTDMEYPVRVAFTLAMKLIADFQHQYP